MTMTNNNVPKLRFEEFTDEWEIKSLKSITDRLTRKNKNLETNNPLTISAQQGLISQTDFFNKVIASDNLKDYYLLKKGEFAYNKSYSNEYPYGAIKRLDLYNEGAISTLYICFTVNDYVDSDFLTIYFESDKWYKEIYKIAVEGARNHGLLNIGVNDFFNTKHNIPSLDEQKKISSFLMAVDKKLKLLNDKKTNFLKFKKYLLQNMFPQNDEKTPKLRFTEYHDEWNYTRLKDVSDIKGGKRIPKGNSLLTTSNNHPYITVSDMENNTINTTNLKYIPETVVDQLKHYTITENDIYISVAGTIGLVGKIPSILNGANLTENADKITNLKINQDFLLYLLQTDILKKLIHRTKTDNAQPKLALKEIRNMVIKYPSLSIEQCKIASFLSSVDKKIDLLDQDIKLVKEYKKGLLQNMFC